MWWLIIILLILYLNKDKIDSYTNYKIYTNYPIQDCPKNYNHNLKRIKEFSETIQPFGYTNREYLDKTRFVKTTEPLPVNADFFIY